MILPFLHNTYYVKTAFYQNIICFLAGNRFKIK